MKIIIILLILVCTSITNNSMIFAGEDKDEGLYTKTDVAIRSGIYAVVWYGSKIALNKANHLIYKLQYERAFYKLKISGEELASLKILQKTSVLPGDVSREIALKHFIREVQKLDYREVSKLKKMLMKYFNTKRIKVSTKHEVYWPLKSDWLAREDILPNVEKLQWYSRYNKDDALTNYFFHQFMKDKGVEAIKYKDELDKVDRLRIKLKSGFRKRAKIFKWITTVTGIILIADIGTRIYYLYWNNQGVKLKKSVSYLTAQLGCQLLHNQDNISESTEYDLE